MPCLSLRFLTAAAVVVGLTTSSHAISLFQVGNSFTFDSKPEATQVMLEAVLGETVDLGYHVRGNTTLANLWSDTTASGIDVTEFGDHTVALPNNAWDFLTLQSFPSISEPKPTLGQELTAIQNFVAAADLGGGGSTEIIVYGPWAGIQESSWRRWNDPAPDDPDTLADYSINYQHLLYDKVEALYPGRTRFAPTGAVIREVRDQILAGEGPLTAFWQQLYRDGIHLSLTQGRFIGSTTMQSVILGRSQVGQPVPSGLEDWGVGTISEDFARWAQLTAWEVLLREQSRSGVLTPDAGDYDGNGVIDTEDLRLFDETYGSSERLLADGSGNGVVDAADYTVWRDAYDAALTAVAVPEPTALVSLVMGNCLLFARRRVA